MRTYEILDSELKISVGFLLYFEKEKSYVIELWDKLDEWTAPLMFAEMAKRGEFTVPRELAVRWVSERVIPSGRQNIADILANERMFAYDEMGLLERSSGKCSQDSLYIVRRDELPDYIEERMQRNVAECVPCGDFTLLCFFNDKTVRKIDLRQATDLKDVDRIVRNEKVFGTAHVAAGGYCITFNDSIDIQAGKLYNMGVLIPLTMDDFTCFVRNNVLDSAECCSLLECSRQNLGYLLSKGRITPVKKDVKGNLYLKGEVLRGR